MHGSAAEDAHAIDRDVIGISVGNGFCYVALIERGLLLTAEAAKWQLVGPLVGEQLPRLDSLPCFQHHYFSAAFAEFLGHDAASGAGADDADIEVFVFAQSFSFQQRKVTATAWLLQMTVVSTGMGIETPLQPLL